jgi:hypothetical protein
MKTVINSDLKSPRTAELENRYLNIYIEYNELVNKIGAMKTGLYEKLRKKYGYNSQLSIRYAVKRGKEIESRERAYQKILKKQQRREQKQLETLNK